MLYRELNAAVKEWWWFRRLREMGRSDEARRLERAAMRGSVDHARRAAKCHGAVVWGLGGPVLIVSPRETVSGFGEYAHRDVLLCARAAGVPEFHLEREPLSAWDKFFDCAW